MGYQKNKFFNRTNNLRLLLIAFFVVLISISIPTFARFKNRVTFITSSTWDGTTATDYASGTGTENDPYIISDGKELSYFQTQLLSDNYSGKYFELSNDIKLNDGTFDYNETDGLMYILDSQTYYIKEYTNQYYDNVGRTGTEVGTINQLSPLDGFKGRFSGNSYQINGLYIEDDNADELALFTDLGSDIIDLYVENSVIYGGEFTGGIASIAKDVTITNTLYDGYVIGEDLGRSDSVDIIPTIGSVNVRQTENTDYIDTTTTNPFIGSSINNTSITGNYTIDGATEQETTIKINGTTITGGSFNVDLGSSLLEQIAVTTITTASGDVTLTFSNLNYNVDYNYGAAAGIVAFAQDVALENVINKADIYGYSTSGGLIGVTNDSTTINYSYNTGSINNDNVAGGLIGVIEKSSNNINVNQTYNSADMSAVDYGGLIGYIANNTGNVSIAKSFNTSTTDYSIGTITNTMVNVNSSYFVNGSSAINNGTTTGSFSTTTLNNLQTKSYLETNLSFSEFETFADLALNQDHVWVFDVGSLPIVFIDDLNTPIANINASIYSWDNLSYDLDYINLGSSIAFTIEEKDIARPFKEVYYYINNSATPLTEIQISGLTWNSYSSMVQITQEGSYIIYAKVVDNNDNIYYLNSDIFVLDWTDPTASITYDNETWNSLKSSLNTLYIDRAIDISVSAEDTLSGLESVDYYITDSVLTENDLDQIANSSWTKYDTAINITSQGTSVVYVRVIDKSSNKIYVNSDYIVYGGYTQNAFYIGKNSESYPLEELYITNKSSFTFNISYDKTMNELTSHTHNLVSNMLFPQNTILKIRDNKTEKVYTYQIPTATDIYGYNDSCNGQGAECVKVATYPFTLFEEMGTGGTTKTYVENTYYANGDISEDFTITVDFLETDFSTNHSDVSVFLELHNSSGDNVRPTLYDSLKTINIFSTVNSQNAATVLNLTTDYSGGTISYNSDSNTSINLSSFLTEKTIDSHTITDTTFEDKEIGLAIKLEDDSNVIVAAEYLDSIAFKIGSNTYYPDDDNVVRINLSNGIIDTNATLSIITYKNNNSLADGSYYFKISNYASYDGVYYDSLGNDEINIPLNVSQPYSGDDYSFTVETNDDYRIINKNDPSVKITFDIMQSGSFTNPNIRVSLYEKDQLTAYNQDYSMVDLASYISDTLTKYNGDVYYVSNNPQENNSFELNLIPTNFANNGYKFRFELYDGDKFVGRIEKYFIVRYE